MRPIYALAMSDAGCGCASEVPGQIAEMRFMETTPDFSRKSFAPKDLRRESRLRGTSSGAKLFDNKNLR
jgi:hypothetical protein